MKVMIDNIIDADYILGDIKTSHKKRFEGVSLEEMVLSEYWTHNFGLLAQESDHRRILQHYVEQMENNFF